MFRTGSALRLCSRGWPAGRLLVLVAAFAGLFTMHGLADHAVPTREMPTLSMSSTAMSTSRPDHGTDSLRAAMSQMASTGQDPAQHSSDLSLAGLCLAVLAGAIVGSGLIRRRQIRALPPPKAAGHELVPRAALRDRDPPFLFELSILRT